MTSEAPLKGIRVADFGHFIAAPLCAALLGDMGADVVRVERPGGSEDRAVTSLFAHADGTPGEGSTFLQLGRNKRSLAVDFATPEGAKVVRRLISWADIIVANFSPRALTKLGLDFPSIQRINPRAILVANSAFEAPGPYAERLGFDGIAQAMSGAVWFSGAADRPERSQAPWVDFSSGMMAAFGALAALRMRDQTGQGQAVSTSLHGTALSVFNGYVMEQAVSQPNRVPHGSRAHTAGPGDLFRCSDGWILVAVQTNVMFRRWAHTVGAPELIDDPRFVDDVARGRNGAALSERMQAWCAGQTVAEAIVTLEQGRIPVGPVYDLEGVLTDPQVIATGAFAPMEFPGLARPAPVAKTPVTLSDFDHGPVRRAPLAGEHNDEVLAELGFDAQTIAAWRAL